MSGQPSDPYAILGVGRQATTEAIDAAFAMKEIEAIQQGIDLDRDEAWGRIRYAYEVLSNPQRRALFDSLVAEAATEAVLDFTIRLSAERLPIHDEPQLLYLLVTARAHEGEETVRRPLNLGLVVDRSTSMRGTRLEKVRAAVRLILEQLGPDDILSLVTFSDRAEVVLPAATRAEREDAAASGGPGWQDSLAGITASGGTEIFYGLAAALAEVRRHAGPDHNSHLILLTDGQTYGDMPDCLQLAEAAANQGIGISAFGIGAEWNDSFLDDLVAPSGGKTGYIQQPEDVIPHLETRLQGLGAVHAQAVRMEQKWPLGVQLRGAFKLSPFAQPLPAKEADLVLGDIEGRSPLVVLLELLVAPQPIPSRIRLPLVFSFQSPETTTADSGERVSTSLRTHSVNLNQQLLVMAAESAAAQQSPPSAELIEAARRVSLYRLQEQAWDDAQAGKPEAAATRMHQLTTRYMETGELQLARQASLEAHRLGRLGDMSPEGRKLLKYGTRSLMNPDDPL